MFQFHAAVRKISDGMRMGHHKNGMPGVMQFAQKLQDYRLVASLSARVTAQCLARNAP